jgi:hypothetical protein
MNTTNVTRSVKDLFNVSKQRTYVAQFETAVRNFEILRKEEIKNSSLELQKKLQVNV